MGNKIALLSAPKGFQQVHMGIYFWLPGAQLCFFSNTCMEKKFSELTANQVRLKGDDSHKNES